MRASHQLGRVTCGNEPVEPGADPAAGPGSRKPGTLSAVIGRHQAPCGRVHDGRFLPERLAGAFGLRLLLMRASSHHLSEHAHADRVPSGSTGDRQSSRSVCWGSHRRVDVHPGVQLVHLALNVEHVDGGDFPNRAAPPPDIRLDPHLQLYVARMIDALQRPKGTIARDFLCVRGAGRNMAFYEDVLSASYDNVRTAIWSNQFRRTGPHNTHLPDQQALSAPVPDLQADYLRKPSLLLQHAAPQARARFPKAQRVVGSHRKSTRDCANADCRDKPVQEFAQDYFSIGLRTSDGSGPGEAVEREPRRLARACPLSAASGRTQAHDGRPQDEGFLPRLAGAFGLRPLSGALAVSLVLAGCEADHIGARDALLEWGYTGIAVSDAPAFGRPCRWGQPYAVRFVAHDASGALRTGVLCAADEAANDALIFLDGAPT